MKKVLFLTHENIDVTAVAKAMLYDLIVEVSGKFDCTLVSAEYESRFYRDSNKINRLSFKRQSQGVISLKDLVSLLVSSISISAKIFKSDIVFFRSYPMLLIFGLVAYLMRKKIVFDTRGLFFEELFDSGKIKNKALKKVFYLLEIFLLRISNKVICVSQKQKEYYSAMVDSSDKYLVFYNSTVRPDSVGLLKDKDEGKFYICYVGSLVSWHCPEKMAAVVNALHNKGVQFEFHCITRDTHIAKELFLNLDNVYIYSHDYRNNPIKFDLGFCLISDNLSKEVCFPVKFSEYLAAQTPILYTSNLSVCNEIAKKIPVGYAVSPNESVEGIVRIIVDEIIETKSKLDVSLPNFLERKASSQDFLTLLREV